jgi:putative DNA primase/helicase
MDLLLFCKAHGILIDRLPPLGVWRRYPTEDHPHKRNGAVKFMGDHAFVQNHATNTETSLWRPDETVKIDHAKIARDVQAAENKRKADQIEAANKAAFILKQCQLGRHDYLKRKGFQDAEGYIWVNDKRQFLVLPMRIDDHLVGCQLIDPDGGKKFLYGQRTSGATLTIDNKGVHILCEGYATALSVREVCKKFKRRYVLHVCFSAGNMKKVAATLPSGVVIADNDASGTGERVAKEIGWPYWMSDVVGEDANDTHQRLGTFKFGQSLLKVL